MRNNLLKVDEESESLNRVAEQSETSKNEDCFYSSKQAINKDEEVK
jgi:hypothetical protein